MRRVRQEKSGDAKEIAMKDTTIKYWVNDWGVTLEYEECNICHRVLLMGQCACEPEEEDIPEDELPF